MSRAAAAGRARPEAERAWASIAAIAATSVSPRLRQGSQRKSSGSTDLFRQLLGALGGLPRRVDVRAAEMAVNRRLAEQRPPEVELLDDPERAQVEQLVDGRDEDWLGNPAGPERVDPDRNRFHDPDRVRDLDLAAPREAGGNDVLGYVPCAVCARSVDLRGVLAREAAAAVARIPAIGVDHDLASSQPGICQRSTNDEPAGGIDEGADAAILELGWD